MKLFGQIVRTVVNVVTLPVTLPVAVVKNVVSGGNEQALADLVETIKRDAEESDAR